MVNIQKWTKCAAIHILCYICIHCIYMSL